MSILIAETGADAILPAAEVNPLSHPLSGGGLGVVDAAIPAAEVNPSSRPLSGGGLGGVDAALPATDVNPSSRPLSEGGLGGVDAALPATDVNPSSRPLSEGGLGGVDAALPALEVNPLSRPLSEGGLGGVDAALPATDVNPSSRPLSEGGLGGVDAALPALEVNPLSRPLSAGGLGLVDGLLRRCGDVIDRIEQGEDLGEIARVMVLTIAVCAGVFGAAVGFYRGGLQIPFAAVKLPLVMLLTAGICTPALTGLRTALEGRGFGQARSDPHGGALGRDVALVLVCLARSSLLIAATAPLVLLALTYGVGYHALILWVVLCCAVGGAAGVSLFTAALARRGGQRSRVVAAIVAVVFVVVGGQMAWTLRPYLVRPRTPEVPFVRSIEGSFLDAVVQTADSARGIYHRRAAPLPNGPDIALPEVVDPAPTDVSSRSVSRDVPVSRADSAASDATRRSDVVEVPIGHAEPASSGASPRSVSSDVPISRAAPPEPSTSTNPTDMRRSMSGREPSP